MIKIYLARSIAEEMNIHTKDAENFLTTFTDIASDSLASGEPVRLSGFRTFDVRAGNVHVIEEVDAPLQAEIITGKLLIIAGENKSNGEINCNMEVTR